MKFGGGLRRFLAYINFDLSLIFFHLINMVFYVENADCTNLIGFLYYNSLFARGPFNALNSTFCQYPYMMKTVSQPVFYKLII